MSHKEELKIRLKRMQEKKTALKLAQEDWIAENKMFNEWMQTVLDVKDSKEELHLAEILTKWDLINDITTTN